MTEFAPHKTLELIAGGNLTFDERVVVRRVDWRTYLQATPYKINNGGIYNPLIIQIVDVCLHQRCAQMRPLLSLAVGITGVTRK